MSEEIEKSGQDVVQEEEAPVIKRRRFGRGIYDSKDVPIRLLDGFIAGIIVLIGVMILVFAIIGGYTVSFDAGNGIAVPSQKLRYGQLAEEPEEPVRPGYRFTGWYYDADMDSSWDFSVTKVGGDVTLTAGWEPAQITVKLDPDGGTLKEEDKTREVTYLQSYGKLPVPEKENSEFDGWVYSGEKITEDSIVAMPGEHVLTATWK